jgi:putative endopeptidase
MRLPKLLLLPLVFSLLTFAQESKPSTENAPSTPATPSATPKRPLKELPYTPSLDVPAMDKSADPCVDFYQYSCGGWIKNNPIPADQPRWSVYGKVADENQQFLWGMLEDLSKPDPKRTESEQKIGDYFQACMDEDSIEKSGAEPLRADLDKIAALKTKAELASFLGRMHLTTTNDNMMFGFGSNQDFEDSTQVIAFVDAGGLGLPDRDYYTKTDAKSRDIRAKYLAHIARMLQLTGDSKAQARANARKIIAMETALAKVSLTRVERRDPYKLFHKMDLPKLTALTPHFNWNDYLQQAGIAAVKTFNVTEPAFFKELNRQIAAQPLANWKTYLRWHLARSRAPYLSKAFVDEDFNFNRKTLRGVTEQQPRWKKCVQWVDRDLGEALGQVFVARTFTPETKAKTVEMTKLVEEAMADEIKQLTWMGDATKKRALEKLKTVANKVGYPDKWRDYSALNVARGEFFGNVNRSIIFESNRQLAKIGKPLDRGEWTMTPPTVNAYYNPQMNDINFPAGVLQPPLYDPKLDDAPNYGNTGSTIGHELTHGFDDEGRQFDDQGNLKDWWTKQDADAFEERVQCVRDQYSQYVIVDDIKINGKLTSGEDVADLGGTLLAYLAWKKATANEKLENRDGFNPDQRFFIGFAQWACENDRPENLRVSALTDPHSPGKYRINGIVSNMPEFERAFSCKAGQPMVRENKCKVW